MLGEDGEHGKAAVKLESGNVILRHQVMMDEIALELHLRHEVAMQIVVAMTFGQQKSVCNRRKNAKRINLYKKIARKPVEYVPLSLSVILYDRCQSNCNGVSRLTLYIYLICLN